MCQTVERLDRTVSNCPMVGQCCFQLSNHWTVLFPTVQPLDSAVSKCPMGLERSLAKLQEELVSRSYRPRSMAAAMERSRGHSREVALVKVARPSNQRPVFCLPYNPRLPGVAAILRKRQKALLASRQLRAHKKSSELELELARNRLKSTSSSSSLLESIQKFELELELARKLCKSLSSSLSLKLATKSSSFRASSSLGQLKTSIQDPKMVPKSPDLLGS